MDKLLLRKKIRAIAAQLAMLRPLRTLVFKLRGVEKDNRELKSIRISFDGAHRVRIP